MDSSRDLSALFDPASVAVVGASDDPLKWGNWLAVRALRGEHRRPVHLVNRRAPEVLGRPSHESLAEIGGTVDLVVLAVPGRMLADGLTDAIAVGARAVVAISAGVDGAAGGDDDAMLARRAREAGVALLGPNCLGVFDAEAQLELVSNDFPSGCIGLLSQSGQLALEIGSFASRVGLGFSRFASLGNQADVVAADLVRELAQHDATQIIAVYLEDFLNGREFIAAAQIAHEAGKPLLLLAIDRSEATARAVQSHTGALASDAATIQAACHAGGITRVRSPRELVDTAEMLIGAPRLRGRRLAVLADGGGHGGVATSLAEAAGLEVPKLSAATMADLRSALPPSAAVTNPIDLAGAGEQDVRTFERTVEALLACGEVDAVLLSGYFGGYGSYGEQMARDEVHVASALTSSARRHGRPLIVHSLHPDSAAANMLRSAGVPVHDAIERTVSALARAAEADERRSHPTVAVELPPARRSDHDEPFDYVTSRRLLAEAGVPFAAARTVADVAGAVQAAAALGYPVVVKALGQLHKSDSGGVVVGVGDHEQLQSVVIDLVKRLNPNALSIEAMAPVGDGAELIVGVQWDPRFGPMVLVGFGGVLTEVLSDTATALAPIGAGDAQVLLQSLRGRALLGAVRGRAALDVAAAAQAISAISRFAAARPDLAELEINPLLVTSTGVVALDARILPPERAHPAASNGQ